MDATPLRHVLALCHTHDMTTTDETPQADAMRSQIEELTRRVDSLSQGILRAEGERVSASSRHVADIEAIGKALIEEANDRDWCEIYDTFVNMLNRSLTQPLPLRTRMYRVSVPITIYVDVEAIDEGEARDAACSTFRRIEDRIDQMAETTGACYVALNDIEASEDY